MVSFTSGDSWGMARRGPEGMDLVAVVDVEAPSGSAVNIFPTVGPREFMAVESRWWIWQVET